MTDGEQRPWVPLYPEATRAPVPAEIERLAALVIDLDFDGALNFISDVVEDGVPPESVLLLLVVPTAHHLGDQWADETREFLEVIDGLNVLRRLVDALRFP